MLKHDRVADAQEREAYCLQRPRRKAGFGRRRTSRASTIEALRRAGTEWRREAPLYVERLTIIADLAAAPRALDWEEIGKPHRHASILDVVCFLGSKRHVMISKR